MKVCELIVEEAKSRRLDHYFGIPGSGDLMEIMEAGRRRGLDFVSVAHESTAAIAAAYYGHFRETAGLAIAIKGPGAAAMAGGAAIAYFERKPVVCLCESVPVGGHEYLAQKCDHTGLFRSVVKYATVIEPDHAGLTVSRAFLDACGYPSGAVLLDLPSGTAGEQVRSHLASDDRRSPPRTDERLMRRAKEFLSGLKRPVVLIGSGVAETGASNLVGDFVKRIGAVVLSAMDSRGVFDETAPRFAGVFAGLTNPGTMANRILGESDGIVLIGFDAMMTEGPWIAEAPTLEIHSDPTLPSLSVPHIRLDGDIKSILAGLSTVASADKYPLELLSDIRKGTSSNFARPRGVRLAMQDVIEISRRLLPEDGVLFSETGVFVLMMERLWPVSRPKTFMGTTASRTMGMMIPSLIGGKLARPDLPMMGIGADGSTLMRLGELEVFARRRIAAPIVVINDCSLGTIKSRQKAKGLPPYGLDLGDVDFKRIAQAVGLRGARVETPEAYEHELGMALDAERATVIDVRVDAEAYRESFGPTIDAI